MCHYVVLRKPTLPEDEGRTQLLGVFHSQEDADNFVVEFCKDGYFSAGDMMVIRGGGG